MRPTAVGSHNDNKETRSWESSGSSPPWKESCPNAALSPPVDLAGSEFHAVGCIFSATYWSALLSGFILGKSASHPNTGLRHQKLSEDYGK